MVVMHEVLTPLFGFDGGGGDGGVVVYSIFVLICSVYYFFVMSKLVCRNKC